MDDYIRRAEAINAIRRIEGVVKLSTSTIGAALNGVALKDVRQVIVCEKCANYHERIIDIDTILQFEHCQKGIRFDNPETFFCGYAIRREDYTCQSDANAVESE